MQRFTSSNTPSQYGDYSDASKYGAADAQMPAHQLGQGPLYHTNNGQGSGAGPAAVPSQTVQQAHYHRGTNGNGISVGSPAPLAQSQFYVNHKESLAPHSQHNNQAFRRGALVASTNPEFEPMPTNTQQSQHSTQTLKRPIAPCPLVGPPASGAFQPLPLIQGFICFCKEQAQQNTQQNSFPSSC